MKKGLHVTLMTVAIAAMAFQAMAMAPVIDAIPDVVVGNETAITGGTPMVTNPTPFYYPDAIDLDSKVADGDTADGSLLWSYSYSGAAIYRINNVDPVTIGPEILAPGAKRINGTTTDPDDGDSLSKTITIRNIKYAPIGGGGETPPVWGGLLDSQAVTLWASDGESSDSVTVLFFTENGGIDRLGTDDSQIVFAPGITTGNNGGFTAASNVGGTVTAANQDGGLCLEVPVTGQNMGFWWGSMDTPLAANMVYIVRARVNGTQASAGSVPFWDIFIDNYSGMGAEPGMNLFGGDMMVLDNEGGANACYNKPSTNGTIITWVWAPAAMLNAAWNDTASGTPGPFATAVGGNRNFRFQFRTMDFDGPAVTGENDSGRICLNKLEVRAVPYSSFTFTNVWSQASLTASNMTAVSLVSGTSPTWASGVCTMSAGPDLEYASIRPGDTVLDLGTPSTIPDNFPVVWESNVLYKAVFDMSAPTETDASNPFDAYWIGIDTVTNELILTSVVTAAQNACGMPKTGAAQPFIAFMHGNSETLASASEFNRLRPRLDIGNQPALMWNPNTGRLNIHAMRVDTAPMPSIPALP